MADSHHHASGSPDAETISKGIQMATQGLKLEPTNSQVTSYLRGLNGSGHRALDLSEASGLEVEIRKTHQSLKLTLDSDEENEKLDFDKLYEECRESQQELILVQKAYLKKSKDLGDIIVDLKEDEVHYENFQDVGKVVDAAYGLIDKELNAVKPQPQGRFQNLAASIRKGFHGFSRNAKNVEPFLEFIPDISGYGSVVVGALSIILKVAAADIRSITDSPTNRILKALSNDAALHEKMSALYAKIFGVLCLVTERVFASSKRWRRFKRAVARLGANEDELSTLRLEMLQKAKDVRHLVQNLGVIKMDRIEKKVGALLDLNLQERIERGNALVQLYSLLTASMEMNKHMSSKVFHLPRFLHKLTIPGQIMTQKKKRRLLAPAPPSLPEVNVDELLEAKGFLRTMIEDDCLELSNIRNSLGGGRDFQKMRKLPDHNRLQAFVTLDTSMVLMVNGEVGSRDDQLSPVSYVVAKLVTTLRTVQQQSPFIISVAFFCGQHQKDGYAGCRELMITLILQLIDQYRAFSAELLNECNRYLGENNLSGLCDLFEKLCYELPEGTMLYCILDGLSSFSFPDKRLQETQMVVGRLLALARGISEKPSACIKFLCATPAICPGVEAVFESWDVLDLDDRTTSSVRGSIDWEDGSLAASMMSQATLE
ncbi:hypothetical protein PG991_016141 [Apiospora marii]|uniref:Nephrocystin 3-like N-terminal domain-containing protein n=1 Tax=Apiospora marii TaxID=335849 RepID=A0ABR1R0Q2_9PEZI